jgi:hypothetical protein
VQGNLDTHEADVANPHSVTAAQASAEPDLGNPSTEGDSLISTVAGTRAWETKVSPDDYATDSVGGTARFRLSGTTLYISTTSTPP